MQLEIKHISQKLKVQLAFSIEKVIIEVENRIDDDFIIFMCVEGNRALGGFNHQYRMYEFFLRSTRNYFNNWIEYNYSKDILSSATSDSWLKPIAPFTYASLNSIRLRYLNHILDNLNKSL